MAGVVGTVFAGVGMYAAQVQAVESWRQTDEAQVCWTFRCMTDKAGEWAVLRFFSQRSSVSFMRGDSQCLRFPILPLTEK